MSLERKFEKENVEFHLSKDSNLKCLVNTIREIHVTKQGHVSSKQRVIIIFIVLIMSAIR